MAVLRGRALQLARRRRAMRRKPQKKTNQKLVTLGQVKRMLNRQGEVKYVAGFATPGENGAPVPIYGDVWPQGTGGGPNGNVQLYTVPPSLSEGVDDYQRIGTKINVAKVCADLDVKFNTNPAISGIIDQASWDVTCHVWYGFVKRYKNEADILGNQAAIVDAMLDDGEGNLFRWLGGPHDQMYRLNNNYVTLQHKKFRMYRPLGTQNDGTVAGGVTTYFPQTIAKRMRLTFKHPKVLRYNEGTSFPQNYCPIIIIGYQHNDDSQASNTYVVGGTYLLPTQVPALEAVIRTHMWYRDA